MAEESTPEWCPNCDDRRCMACVFREVHDACEESCPFCCAEPSEGTTEPPETSDPLFEALLLAAPVVALAALMIAALVEVSR